MAKFRKKPVEIEAVQFTGDNMYELMEFNESSDEFSYRSDSVIINTLEGDMKANVGDWIIKGVNGEFYPCKPEIFEKTYEPVN